MPELQRCSNGYKRLKMAVDLATHTAYMEKLNDVLVYGDIADVALVPPAMELVFAIRKRVSEQGKASDGSQMRKYSTTPMYANRSQFVNGGFNPQGKNNANGITIGDRLIPTPRLKQNGLKKNPAKYKQYSIVKANLTPRKTMYLKEGYKELRDVQGLRTDITNMKYRGTLLNDFWLGKEDNAVVTGLLTQDSSDKYRGLSEGTRKMKGRGPFLVATEEEKRQYLASAQFNITRLTRNILNGHELNATIG